MLRVNTNADETSDVIMREILHLDIRIDVQIQ